MYPTRSISPTPRSKFGPACAVAANGAHLARPFSLLRNLELAVKRQFRLRGAVAACACMAARALSSGFSSVGRPRAKGAMRWPRTENCSPLEHLTPSECRRATGTTLDAEYLSAGLQVQPYAAASAAVHGAAAALVSPRTPPTFASPRPHATCALLSHPPRVCTARRSCSSRAGPRGSGGGSAHAST